jgi:chromosome segregation ATPase
MKEQLDRIEAKVDKLDDRLDKNDIHLAMYNEQLKMHIKRTELAEKAIDVIMAHINKVNGALKLLASAGIILALVKLYQTVGG